jgi:S1-C subfamily serine protease
MACRAAGPVTKKLRASNCAGPGASRCGRVRTFNYLPALTCGLVLVFSAILCSALLAWPHQPNLQTDSPAAQSTVTRAPAANSGTKADQDPGSSTEQGSAPETDQASAKSGQPSGAPDSRVSAALAPVVYPDDQTPQARGYQYTFFGNAFFINEQGYLLTVAHVLDTFSNASQPSILLNRTDAPPRLVKVSVVAQDAAHDVAILRATPNPFAANYIVSFVPLSSSPPVRGESVLALSLRPKKQEYALSFELPLEDSAPGTVLSFESTQLAKSAPPADVFLLSHPVIKGQSGSPVMDAQTQAVIGLVEGLWLRGTYGAMSKATPQPDAVPGAAIPIQYAIALLKAKNVNWHAAAPLPSTPDGPSLH